MKLSERSIRIKKLLPDSLDMGTFGLIELELIEFDNEIELLKRSDSILPAFIEESDSGLITIKTAGTDVSKDWEEYLKLTAPNS